ncbi:MAG: TRAP transporter small permease subunit [Alphaproteobacteria bacterium]
MARWPSLLGTGLILVGSVGLVGAMLVDGVAVAGRHLDMPFTGSIELSQVCVVLLASCSIALATLHRGHAVVDLLHQRLGPGGQRLLLRIAALLGFIFLVSVLAGLTWLAADLWNGREHTELLNIPIRWQRVLMIACFVIAAGGFFVNVLVPEADPEDSPETLGEGRGE